MMDWTDEVKNSWQIENLESPERRGSRCKPLFPPQPTPLTRGAPWIIFRTIPAATPTGKYRFFGDATNGDLISVRLQPYLDAGYGFADITLMLSDIPWDASAAATMPTPYCLVPPGNLKITRYPATGGFNFNDNCMRYAFPRLWQAIINHLTEDLIAHYGAANASRFGFEMGDEWDSEQSVDMSATQYRHIYEGAYSAIHALLRDAAVLPGDFSGSGDEPLDRGKVYNTLAVTLGPDEMLIVQERIADERR